MSTHINLEEICILIILNSIIFVSSYHVDLFDNGPIVRGANITFTAVLYDSDGNRATGSFVYTWVDNAVPTHSTKNSSQSAVDTWTVLYDRKYPAGRYVAQVEVCKYYLSLYCASVASNRLEFFINETLNGDLQLIQNNKTRNNIYVSNANPVVHNVTLKPTDAEFISQATSVVTYWFVDCTYYGFRRGFEFSFNYTKPEEEHYVEALVVADFTPLPPPTTTTVPTTTSTTTTTVKPNTTTAATTTTTTTTKPTTVTTTVVPKTTLSPSNSTRKTIVKRDANEELFPKIKKYGDNGTLVPYNDTFPFVCNGTNVATDPKKTYGYFFKRIKVRVPVSKVNVTGNNWLQHGDILTLNVKCHSSRNLRYCVNYEKGVYNVTNNENCSSTMHELEKCEFTIQHYLIESMEHTIVIIIENEVSKVVTPVTVTVYKVKKQAQLSVIVVPVAFSLVAVVLIVFGVAYYIQNRSRFVVEVADFNFGQNFSDMEYKTFKERLRDSIANAFFTRAPSPGSSEVPVWPPGRKYGSMTS